MPATVLICDDQDVLRTLIRESLDRDEYSIVEARDGDESLELARRLRPDLIILDMMMPGRTGLEVLAELRADAELAGTPVIMLTARAQATDREAVVKANADRYLAKPFSLSQLAATVEGLLEGR